MKKKLPRLSAVVLHLFKCAQQGRLAHKRKRTVLNPTEIPSVCRRNDGNEQNRAGNSAKETQRDIIHGTGLPSSPGRQECVTDTARSSGRAPGPRAGQHGRGEWHRRARRCRTRCRLRPRRISRGRPADLIAPRLRRPAGSPRAARCQPLEGAAGRPQSAPQPGADVRPGRGLRRQRPRPAPQGPPRDAAEAAAAA